MLNRKFIYSVFLSLILLDLVLTIWGFFFPELWYSFFHGVPYIDPQALLQRSAANWLGFLILQIIAFFKWEKSNWWLILVAGSRFTDSLTDITCLTFSSNITIFGIILFPVAGIGNIIIGILLVKSYLNLKKEKSN